MPLLQVIVASTRPGRVGRAVAEWFTSVADRHPGFDVELVDLAEVALPFLDEPRHPRLRQYEHDHTRAWSTTVDRADAFAFVMPEYNHGFNAPLKNAIDFLWQEWNDKPVALVGYGGVSGGTRAVELLKPVLSAVQLVAVGDLPIPFVARHIEDGRMAADPDMDRRAERLLDELARVEAALAPLRDRVSIAT